MRKALTIAAMTIFVFGCFWQFGRWLLRWSGYGLGLRSQPGGYYEYARDLRRKDCKRPQYRLDCRTLAVDEHRSDDPNHSSFVDD